VHNKIDAQNIIVDSKSGVTGAGAKSKAVNHFCSANENFMAYGLKKHRHTIEIQQTLATLSDVNVRVQFTPHLLPLDRGILTTTYSQPDNPLNDEELEVLYREFYKGQPFIRIVQTPPTVKQVRGSNYCDIFVTYDDRTGNIITVSAIDNLVKGAAGQAVHNMNLRMNFDIQAGLDYIPLQP
jgi:N-acetyl-gamma-glutamyl-phosphate reductase